MHAAFFYGTLMSPDVRSRVLCGPYATEETVKDKFATLRFRPAVLKGHRRFALKNLVYPGVVRTDRPEDRVIGILCEGLNDRDVKLLDEFEGDEYERTTVTVYPTTNTNDALEEEEEAGGVDCQVYIWTAGDHHLEAHDWELDGFVARKQAIWLQELY
ncbi:hypothetical protein VTP01DRAFT_2090 [Rhizomucor pusillus]|uniref:uncharacterized protein n=1 Tax=Rhizomucor pusillus TaxID=4840 RepID=UPI0037426CD9